MNGSERKLKDMNWKINRNQRTWVVKLKAKERDEYFL